MNIKKSLILVMAFVLVFLAAECKKSETQTEAAAQEFKWQIDQFADLKILRYKVPGFAGLSLAKKELVYYLGEAALCGRDIIFAQNY